MPGCGSLGKLEQIIRDKKLAQTPDEFIPIYARPSHPFAWYLRYLKVTFNETTYKGSLFLAFLLFSLLLIGLASVVPIAGPAVLAALAGGALLGAFLLTPLVFNSILWTGEHLRERFPWFNTVLTFLEKKGGDCLDLSQKMTMLLLPMTLLSALMLMPSLLLPILTFPPIMALGTTGALLGFGLYIAAALVTGASAMMVLSTLLDGVKWLAKTIGERCSASPAKLPPHSVALHLMTGDHRPLGKYPPGLIGPAQSDSWCSDQPERPQGKRP